MLFIAIVDDNELTRKKIKNLISNTLFDKPIEFKTIEFSNGEDLIANLKDYNFDLILLDIEMDGLNGLDVLSVLDEQKIESIIIFITSYEGYMKLCFNLNVLSYILKEELEETLPKALIKAISKLNDFSNYLFRTENGNINVKENEIVFITISNRKIYIHLIYDTIQIYETSIKQLANKLGPNFIKPNASYLVNMKFIKNIHNGIIYLRNYDEIIFISKGKIKEINQQRKLYLIKDI